MGNCLCWVSRVKSDHSPSPPQDSERDAKRTRKNEKKMKMMTTTTTTTTMMMKKKKKKKKRKPKEDGDDGHDDDDNADDDEGEMEAGRGRGRGRGRLHKLINVSAAASSEKRDIWGWNLKGEKLESRVVAVVKKKADKHSGSHMNNKTKSKITDKKKDSHGNSSDDMDCDGNGLALRCFTFGELRTATRNFRPDSLLGEGGFGCVFKGWMVDKEQEQQQEQASMAPRARPCCGIVIAVKKLNLEGLQGHKEWLAEVHFLGQLHHPNLVRLIGYCAEDDHRLLVYEFMPRGSLENHLFRRGSHGQALSWLIRVKVTVGAARGLAFLHEAEKPVIFRDFKTSNILLDSQFHAKLSDFGLAKDGPTGDNTHVSTRVMGTYGYAAPEYVATGHLTAKSDVYSFGVVLLEVLTGRRAVDKNRPIGEQNLVEWARPYLSDKRKVFRIIDPRMEGQYSMKGVYRAATLALRCLNQDAKVRPAMKDVVQLLEPLLNLREIAKYSQCPSSAQDHSIRPQYIDSHVAIKPRNPNLGALIRHPHMCSRTLHPNYGIQLDRRDLLLSEQPSLVS